MARCDYCARPWLRHPDYPRHRVYVPAAVKVGFEANGILRLSSPQPLASYRRSLHRYLLHWASRVPGRYLVREQPRARDLDEYAPYARALQSVASLHEGLLVVGGDSQQIPGGALLFKQLQGNTAPAEVDRAFAAVMPDTVAKILFTSGSTDEPKGVINTQRMLCSNQQAKAQVWPFLESVPPVLVDWLPWNHTFGANHNVNLILRNGGTLYIDHGRPLPGRFGETQRNLREIAPTLYFNVPRGYELLIPALQEDERLCQNFFSRLQLMFYAAASLPQSLWDALIELCAKTAGQPIPLTSAWGIDGDITPRH